MNHVDCRQLSLLDGGLGLLLGRLLGNFLGTHCSLLGLAPACTGLLSDQLNLLIVLSLEIVFTLLKLCQLDMTHLSEVVLLLLEPLKDMIEPVSGLDTIDLEPLYPEALDGRPQPIEVTLYPGRLEGNSVLGVLRTGLAMCQIILRL